MNRKRLRIPFLVRATVTVAPSEVRVTGLTPGGRRRIVLVFSPMQAMKVTSEDCFPGFPPGFAGEFAHVSEVVDSAWVRELRDALRRADSTADFMEMARHFILSAQDGVLEVVAWDWRIEKVGKSRTNEK